MSEKALTVAGVAMSEKALTVAEVAEALQVDGETVRTWLRKGKLEGTKLPNNDWRVWPSKLEKWIEQRSTVQRVEGN